jgi:hypothetical protein
VAVPVSTINCATLNISLAVFWRAIDPFSVDRSVASDPDDAAVEKGMDVFLREEIIVKWIWSLRCLVTHAICMCSSEDIAVYETLVCSDAVVTRYIVKEEKTIGPFGRYPPATTSLSFHRCFYIQSIYFVCTYLA